MKENIASLPHTAGLRTTLRAIETRRAKQVFIAEDADIFVKRRIQEACLSLDIQYSYVPTMKELGEACALQVSAACAAIVK